MGYFYFISLRSVRDHYFIECSRTRSSPHARPPPWEKRRVGNRELAALSQPASSPRAPRSVFSLVVHTTHCLERGAGPSESRRTKTFVFRPGAPSLLSSVQRVVVRNRFPGSHPSLCAFANLPQESAVPLCRTESITCASCPPSTILCGPESAPQLSTHGGRKRKNEPRPPPRRRRLPPFGRRLRR